MVQPEATDIHRRTHNVCLTVLASAIFMLFPRQQLLLESAAMPRFIHKCIARLGTICTLKAKFRL